MMKKLKHSLGDWNYRPNTDLIITTDHCVSSPSSIANARVSPSEADAWIFLKASVRQNIPEGRLITYTLIESLGQKSLAWFFRAQALPPAANPQDCYDFEMTATQILLRKIVAGSSATLKTENLTYTWNFMQWYHYRMTWYEFIDANLDPVLRCTFETQIGAEWVEQLTHDIPNPLWSDSATNLVGMLTHAYTPAKRQFIDDTEIWEKI